MCVYIYIYIHRYIHVYGYALSERQMEVDVGGASWLSAGVRSMPSVSLCRHLILDNRVVSSRGFPGEKQSERQMTRSLGKSTYFGRGDDTVGNPHRPQIVEFELFELKRINSSFSSSSSC